MVSSAFVLLVLLSESSMLHRQLVLAMAAREQEREGHRTAMDVMVESLAHELRQPLAAIQMNGQAGAIMVSATPSGLDDVRAAFTDISKSASRANEIIDSVRTVFAHSPHDQVTLEVNDLVREAVDIMRLEFEASHVVLELDLSPELPTIRGHRGQLTQVLMNGVKNGVESLATVSDRERHLRIRTVPLEPGRRRDPHRGFRTRRRSGRAGPRLRAVLFDEAARHGAGAVHLQVNHRGARGHAVASTRLAAWRRIPGRATSLRDSRSTPGRRPWRGHGGLHVLHGDP